MRSKPAAANSQSLLLLIFLSGILVVLGACGNDDDNDSGDDDTADDDDDSVNDDDSTDDDDETPIELELFSISPSQGGASVPTQVTLVGNGFFKGMSVFVGLEPAGNIEIVSHQEATAVFYPVDLLGLGKKDVLIELEGQSAHLSSGFEYLFDEDPIVFIHGYVVSDHEWNTMIDRFRSIGYPEQFLAAIRFSTSIQSNVINAEEELPTFVEEVLTRTGADKVDVIAHSMGGLSSRLWIKFFGGGERVRDYVSVSGTHHGSYMGFFTQWLGEAGEEMYPAYALQNESHNLVQWNLNGDPDLDDVDETPFGVEDGGGIFWNALWTDNDGFVRPPNSSCLNQSHRNDCTDPVNLLVPGVGHFGMVYDQAAFEIVQELVRKHNPSKP